MTVKNYLRVKDDFSNRGTEGVRPFYRKVQQPNAIQRSRRRCDAVVLICPNSEPVRPQSQAFYSRLEDIIPRRRFIFTVLEPISCMGKKLNPNRLKPKTEKELGDLGK